MEKSEVLLEHLLHLKKMLERHEVEYWLNYGTLLGAARNGEIIEWDNDIDLSAWSEDRETILRLCRSLKNNGYRVTFQKNLPWTEDLIQIYPPENQRTEGMHHSVENMHIDIYLFTKLRDEACMRRINAPAGSLSKALLLMAVVLADAEVRLGFTQRKIFRFLEAILRGIFSLLPGRFQADLAKIAWLSYFCFADTYWLVAPVRFFAKFSCTTLHNHEFPIPFNYEEYLAYLYGPDWRMPNPNYNNTQLGGRIRRKLVKSWGTPEIRIRK